MLPTERLDRWGKGVSRLGGQLEYAYIVCTEQKGTEDTVGRVGVLSDKILISILNRKGEIQQRTLTSTPWEFFGGVNNEQ